MGTLPTLGVPEDSALLAALAQVLAIGPLAPGFLGGDGPAGDDELEAFEDWDAVRGHGRGFFSSDAHERATRRLDLRGPTDLDPGPLAMEEAPPDVTASAWYLTFRP
jgi:hypothetical protein